MKKQTLVASCLLIIAAVTFWISWFLMPDPGTTDTNHILRIVKSVREFVWISAITQIVSSACYTIALFLIADLFSPQKKTTLIGLALFGIGAMGMCADAFFHLLAYYMTDDSVLLQENVVIVMTFMQTKGVVILIPLMLPFFIGSILLGIGLRSQNAVSKLPMSLFLTATFVGIGTAIVAKQVFGYSGRIVSLSILGAFAFGQAWIGSELLRFKKD
ncbi:hypothetical protein DLM76_04145 [Leptospira yasudae]|uniref:hypothetical protein n=1 Tax=Leptospira yasudae TaxID=2202201 RepID=UPI000E5A03CD|nr:hypothetical protein [Leptospira yasudae]RHX96154.1 hypothetical protein DLM76_04145 [Leptospira yasudae]